ncbi:MAG: endolytic transglycosylase MltG [Desulfobacteraceae bacterium]|nr:endolytic transglycosylase MltG [Desulfobacteraceae bacterium]
MIKKVLLVLFFIVLTGAIAVTLLAWDLSNFSHKPAGTEQIDQQIVIRSGLGFNQVTDILYERGLITHKWRFRLVARVKKADKKLKAGEYLMSTDMTPIQILDKLVSGKVLLHRLTIPEGYNLNQIAETAETAGFNKSADFLFAATRSKYARELNIPADTFEGYLFPDTYFFPSGVTPDEIIATMVHRFWTQFPDEFRTRADELGLSIHQVVTLASIIEKETGAASERPLISSVFHNRLKKKMRLESDPTVIYGIEDFDGNIKRSHLRAKTPYNTYQIRGLPPGPIASPGRDAVKAALFPADTSFLFFVSKKDSTHYFSKTIAEHNKAVKKYQLRR